MKKKIIGLSILLLVLLLGLSTNCYARQQTITTDNVNELFNYYNSYWYNNANVNTLKNNVINSLNTYQDTYDNCIFFVYNLSNGRHSMMIFYFNNSNTTLNYYNNTTSWQINSSEIRRFQVVSNSYDIITSVTTSASNDRGQYFMIRNDLGSLTGPFQSSNIMTFIEPIIPFTFIPKLTDTYADVWTYEDVPFYNASGEDLLLGQLFVPSDYQGYKTSTIFYWQYGNWQFKELTDYATYSVYVGTENGSSIYDIYLLREYINENMLYDITFTDTTTEPLYTLAKCVFYIKNNYTVINNGVLDTSNTFSGDYKDKYDDDLQNQQDVDNISQAINDTINQPVDVSGELSQYFSGDVYDIANSFGFDSTVSVYFTFIEDFLKNVCNVLLDDNDVYFDYSMHGENATRIYSSDINLPNGHPLKVFISIILVFLTVYLLYYQFMKLFELLQTADLSNAIKSQDVSFYIFKM